MSYLALARKWRPKIFQDIVGQDHVVRAITNALDSGRLHHAWLFTGTRGVGKTTLSRILAKSLNCEQGVTSTPCGVCRACVQIDEGRFVDYFEFDAASNRKAEEISLLLDQAVYAPSMGRFKVYMIDEVHMLTGHAFNAMLKTLEEPPEHVKFILATTDPQKIPMTVLSRCLQFSLKQMSVTTIMTYLSEVLTREGVTFDEGSLYLLAQSARGSMRDALSVTDQAIAFSKGALTQSAIESMLGSIDQRYLVRCLDALYHQDASVIVSLADELDSRGFSYEGALNDLSALLAKISIEQRMSVVEDNDPLRSDILRLSHMFSQEQLQLFYTIAIHTRSELLLAPDEYYGFIMGLFKMLALMGPPVSGEHIKPSLELETIKPVTQEIRQGKESVSNTQPVIEESSFKKSLETSKEVDSSLACTEPSSEGFTSENKILDSDLKKNFIIPKIDNADTEESSIEHEVEDEDIPISSYEDVSSAYLNTLSEDIDQEVFDTSDTLLDIHSITRETWPDISRQLPLQFLGYEIIYDSEWVCFENSILTLKITLHDIRRLQSIRQGIETAISEACGQTIQVRFEYQSMTYSAKAVDQQKAKERQEKAIQDAHSDPFIQKLKTDFDGILDERKIRVIN